MKKNVLFIFLFTLNTLFSFSQTLMVIDSVAGELANDAIIYKSGVNTLSGEIVQHFAVSNVSGNDAQVMVKKSVVDTVPGTVNLFCWGLCFGPETYVSPEPVAIPAGTIDWQNFSGHYTPIGHAGATTIRYTFYIDRVPEDSVCVNVVYMAFPLSTEDIEAKNIKLSNAYPNPAKNEVSFNINIPAGANASLIIRDILGSGIRKSELSATSGKTTLPISDLSEGIYFCTLVLNGTETLTRKIVVRR